jgi:hypothetical protein
MNYPYTDIEDIVEICFETGFEFAEMFGEEKKQQRPRRRS